MATRKQLYTQGLAAAVAAHAVKLLKEKKSRPPNALADIADRSKSREIQRNLRGVALMAYKSKEKNVSRADLAATVRFLRARAIQARRAIAAKKTKGGARASQLKQIRGLSAWIRRSEPRKAKR